MKIRLSNQEIRIRIDREDLNFLEINQYLKEELNIGNGSKFEILLIFSDHSLEAALNFKDGILKIFIPEIKGNEWMISPLEGLYFSVGEVKLSIEKDKGCKH
ncbi:MAG: hypothetical protein RJA52_434 [Bacteroidota bacterium]